MAQLPKFPQRYTELEDEMLPSSGSGYSDRVSGSKTPPLPVRIETLHLRTGGISIPLMKHERVMREIRKETKVSWSESRKRGELQRITLTCEYIYKRKEWAWAEYADAPNLAKDIIEIHSKISFTLGNRTEEIVIGTCPTINADETICGFKLRVNPAALERSLEIRCKGCGTVWDSTKWRLLGKMLDSAQ